MFIQSQYKNHNPFDNITKKSYIFRIIYFILILFLLLDFGYSFMQYYHTNLDGDMAEGILRANKVDKVFHDPFGIKIFFSHEKYPNPNRFFSHWSFSYYFQTMPFVFQRFFNPIDSIYLTCALIKVITKILFIYLLAACISGIRNVLKIELILSAILITPLFQTFGYEGYMGIIMPSITYFFFYSLPLCLLVLFFAPFYNFIIHKKPISILAKIVMLILSVILPFSGPLIPGIILIICPLIFVDRLIKTNKESPTISFMRKINISLKYFPGYLIFVFTLFCLLCAYSLYIGTLGSDFYDNIIHTISLKERYLRLPIGLYYQLTQKLGLLILLLMIIINTIIIRKNNYQPEGKKIIHLLKGIVVFSLFYILLLPLGGFKIYRPNILRFDTFMPITLCIVFFFGLSTYFIIKNANKKYRKWYIFTAAAILIVFINADRPRFEKNLCEKQALETLSKSPDKVVLLNNDCTVMSWNKITNQDESDLNARLFYYWGITNEVKKYYQPARLINNLQ